jgi:hypothetical protein
LEAWITIDGKKAHLCSFDDEEAAARAYDEAVARESGGAAYDKAAARLGRPVNFAAQRGDPRRDNTAKSNLYRFGQISNIRDRTPQQAPTRHLLVIWELKPLSKIPARALKDY